MSPRSKLWLLSVMTACQLNAPTDPQSAVASERESTAAESGSPAAPEISASAVVETIGYLASDELNGRYTLSPEIETAAQWLASRYRDAGLEAVADNMVVPYALNTGAKESGDQSLTVHPNRGPAMALEREDFGPLPYSANGSVRAPAVFVGYAVSSDPNEAGEVVYDDLDGVDLKGKIAVVFLDAPGQPNYRELMEFLTSQGEAYAAAAGPLVDAEDEAGLKKLHKQVRENIAEALSGFMRGKAMPDEYWKVRDPMVRELDIFSLLGPVMKLAREYEGPQFSRSARLSTKLERLANAGASGVVLIRGPRSFFSQELREQDALPKLKAEDHGVLPDTLGIPVVQMKWKKAKRLLRTGGLKVEREQKLIDEGLKPRSKPLGLELELGVTLEPEQVKVPNVVAAIPGSDLADELVVFGAHFDHIGDSATGECREDKKRKDAICNGADDNASGTAMVLELARTFAKSGFKPRRTLIFASFSGEEMGLLGSAAMAKNPPFDRDKVVAMVNIDMIGRLKSKGLMIGGLATSAAWMPMLDEIGPKGMEITYERSSTSRSDHANFFRYDIPSLFFFTGTHSDYHRPGDHVEEINEQGLQSIGDLMLELATKLAEGAPIEWREPPENEGLVGRLPGKDPTTVEKKVEADPPL